MGRLLRPRWIAVHLLAVAAVAVTASLGVWQLQRLDERRARNDLVEQRLALPAEPVGDLVDPDDEPHRVDDELRFRPVTAAGTYRGGGVSVRTTLDGVPGGYRYDVLELEGDEAVWVLRGFGAFDEEEGGVVVAPPADAVVDVEGIAVPIDRLPATSRRGLEAVERDDLLPVVVQARAVDGELSPVPLPELDEGPHLGYAVQWFLFATVILAGYPFLLRRRLRDDDGLA